MNEIVKKMALAVRWREQDINTVLIGAERAAQTLWRRKLPLEDFLELGRKENLYAAEILAARLVRSGQLSGEEAAAGRKRAVEDCRREYIRLRDAGIPVFREERKGQEEDAEACGPEMADPARFLQWQGEVALLCAAEIFLEEEELARQTVMLFAEKIVDKEQAAPISRQIFALFRCAPNELECQIRLYQVFYETFDMEWAVTVAYRQGVEVLLPETIPEKLKALILTALQNGHLRYVDQVLKIFLPVRLSQLDLTEEKLMEIVFQGGSKELFRGILFAEKMIMQDVPSPLEGVNRWWSILCSANKEGNGTWQELQDWFEVYYLARQVTVAPEQAQTLLSGRGAFAACRLQVRKMNMTQQDSFEILFWQENKCILKWLDVLGESNAYQFRPEEEYYPLFERNPSYDMSGAIGNLIRQGCTREEMLRIYMNTHLRCMYSISAFLRLLFAGGEGVKVLRGGEADVGGYFADYHLAGYVTKWNGCFGFRTQNICMGSKIILFPVQWQQKNEGYCRKALEEGRKLYFHITRMNLNHFSLRGVPDELPVTEGDKAASFEKICEELEEIIRLKTLTTAQNKRISVLALSEPPTKAQSQRLGLLMVNCCCALGEKPSELRYFINMINRMGSGQLNPWRHQAFRKQGSWYRLPEEVSAQVLTCWETLKACPLSAEELFFVYINTLFKYCIPFSEMVESRCDKRTLIVDVQKMLGEHTKYFFSGRIHSIAPDRRQGKNAWFVYLLPNEFYRGNEWQSDLFYLKTENIQGYKQGLLCQFEIRSYRVSKRTFVVKEIIHQQDVRSAASRPVFLAAMNRAAYSKYLSERDLGDLKVEVTGWSSQNMGKLALPMLNGLKLRGDSITEVNLYLNAIEKSNPWKFSQKAVPCRQSWPAVIQGENVQGACRNLLVKFIEQYDLRSVLRIYFHTVLKSYIGLDTAIALCKTAGSESASLGLWMGEYPLTVRKSESGWTGINFLVEGDICFEETEIEAKAAEGEEHRAFFADYDEGAGILWLRCHGAEEGKE